MALNVSICEKCGEIMAPPRSKCPECRKEMDVVSVDGKGVVATHTTVHVVPEGFEAPIRIGLVKLDMGGQVLAKAEFDLDTGMRVDVEELGDGTHRMVGID